MIDHNIEFRVWSTERREFLHSYAENGVRFEWEGDYVDVGWFLDCIRLESPIRFIVQQFIGITDKTDQKVFCGDVIKGPYVGGLVRFFSTYGMFGTADRRTPNQNKPKGRSGSSTSYAPYVLTPYYSNRIEVVGNYLQNPDLLEKEFELWASLKK